MARTADRATPSPRPNIWRMYNQALAAVPLAFFKLLFCIGVLAIAWFCLRLEIGQMQTLTFIMLVFAGQAVVYVVRERGRMRQSRPVLPMMLFSLIDVGIVSTFAISGIFIIALPMVVVPTLLVATVGFALALDQLKVMVFRPPPD